MALSREEILTCPDVESSMTEVAVPEWGGSVFVRVMTGTERGRFEMQNSTAPKDIARARVAALTICDDEGKLLFTPADVEMLGQKSSRALDRVLEVAIKVNGIGPESVEDEAKNSEAIPS